MKTIRKLQEVSTVSEAEVILRENKAGPAVRRLVETGIALKNHADPNQRQLGQSFILDAIREVEEDDLKEANGGVKPMNSPSAGEVDLEKKINEEVLSNHNPHTANAGSEQSSDNTQPYPQEGKDAPNSDIESMQTASGENQMKEAGLPPIGIPGQMPGMDPRVAAEMGQKMPQMPPMTLPQQMQQTQYTINETIRRTILPYLKEIKQIKGAVTSLQKQIQEIQLSKSGIALDMNKLNHTPAIPVRITETQGRSPLDPEFGVPEFKWERAKLEETRARISEQDNLLNQTRK